MRKKYPVPNLTLLDWAKRHGKKISPSIDSIIRKITEQTEAFLTPISFMPNRRPDGWRWYE